MPDDTTVMSHHDDACVAVGVAALDLLAMGKDYVVVRRSQTEGYELTGMGLSMVYEPYRQCQLSNDMNEECNREHANGGLWHPCRYRERCATRRLFMAIIGVEEAPDA